MADEKTQWSVPKFVLSEEHQSEELHKYADGETRRRVQELAWQLPNVADLMKVFSANMRSLYAEWRVSASVENGKEFIRLRDAIRNDALVYVRGVMPMNEICLSKLQEYVSYYESFDFDDWKEYYPDILTEVAADAEACQALVKVHESYSGILKQRQDKANELCSKFKNLQVEYDKEVLELKERAERKNGWLPFYMGSIASPHLTRSVNTDLAEAVAKREQLKIMLRASSILSNSMMTALTKFIKALKIVAGFFNIVHNELKSFDDKMEDKKKLHYITLRKYSPLIKRGCRAFHGALPSVKTNFQAIPTGGTDENYVDQWLKKQEKIIDENCKQMSLQFLRRALKAASGSLVGTQLRPKNAVRSTK